MKTSDLTDEEQVFLNNFRREQKADKRSEVRLAKRRKEMASIADYYMEHYDKKYAIFNSPTFLFPICNAYITRIHLDRNDIIDAFVAGNYYVDIPMKKDETVTMYCPMSYSNGLDDLFEDMKIETPDMDAGKNSSPLKFEFQNFYNPLAKGKVSSLYGKEDLIPTEENPVVGVHILTDGEYENLLGMIDEYEGEGYELLSEMQRKFGKWINRTMNYVRDDRMDRKNPVVYLGDNWQE